MSLYKTFILYLYAFILIGDKPNMNGKQTKYPCSKCGAFTTYKRHLGFFCPTHGSVY
jgi:hypothetical protein